MKYIVKYIDSNLIITKKSTELAAIRAGRKHMRNFALEFAADGFNVFLDNQLIRKQRCNNFGNNWKEA